MTAASGMARSRSRRPFWAVAAPLWLLSLLLAGCGPSAETVTAGADGGRSPDVADVFDNSFVHEIAVSFAQADYDAMIETYKSTEAKDWIEATVTIDGETYAKAGMRLKGNSSISPIRTDGAATGMVAYNPADRPEGLPWLIRLDKYVDGQNLDGITNLVIRSNASATALNEAVAVELIELAGLESVKVVAARVSVNGSAEAFRLVSELPDELWMQQHFSGGGALYKAESTGDYSYRGADPESYAEVFDQEAGKNNADLTPLIEFLDFINNADDVTFSAELPKRLDIVSFATYLATEDLLRNSDDIDGPGNNSYLYFDPAGGMFTVIPWDHNLALAAKGRGQMAGGTSNALVERFHAVPEFRALYEEKLEELTATLYESGAAAAILAERAALLETQASDLVAPSALEQEASRIAELFTGLEPVKR